MDLQAIFGLQFLMSLVAWGMVMAIFFSPQLSRKPLHEALMWLTIPHGFRHIGLAFLVPALNDRPLPEGFAQAAAYGDFATGILALLTLVALRNRWRGSIPLTWLLNVVGTVDLANALRHVEVASSFGTTWFIPTMIVPLLLVTHFLMLKRLLGEFFPALNGHPDIAPGSGKCANN